MQAQAARAGAHVRRAPLVGHHRSGGGGAAEAPLPAAAARRDGACRCCGSGASTSFAAASAAASAAARPPPPSRRAAAASVAAAAPAAALAASPARRRRRAGAAAAAAVGPPSLPSFDAGDLAGRLGGLDSNQLQTALAAALGAEDYPLAAAVRDELAARSGGGGAGSIDWRDLGVPEWLADRAARLGFRFPTGAGRAHAASLRRRPPPPNARACC